MHARVVTVDAYENKLEELIATIRDKVLPAARQLHGFEGAMVMGDERTNTASVISFWHRADEEQASARAPYFEAIMREVSTTLGYRQEIETFEVMFAEWPHHPVGVPPTPSGDTQSSPQ